MNIHPDIYTCVVISHALKLYKKTGMKVNSAYTPKNMMAAASRITGQKFKARDYLGAADALIAHADKLNGRKLT